MKIVSLTAENVKRLRAVTIEPKDASLVVIKGQNGQGKTSVIDSIAYALGGKDLQPPKVIRDGEEAATTIVDLGDLVVKRRWTSGGKTYLEVKSKDGAKYTSPQAILDGLVGRLSFDPLAFTRLDPKAQADTLRELVGLDFRPLEAKRQAAYDERTQINRELTAARSRLVSMPPAGDAPEEEVSIGDLLQKQDEMLAQKAENDRARAAVAQMRQQLEATRAAMRAKEELVARLRRELMEAESALVELTERVRDDEHFLTVTTDGLAELKDPDLTDLRAQLGNANAINMRVRHKKSRVEVEQRVRTLEAKSEECTAAIAAIDAQKTQLLTDAKFPVPGLSFSVEGVTLNGIPLQQASAAEQLRVSLAMGLAANPKLKIILIRDGSLLDDKSMALVAAMAQQAEAQVWIERVGDRDAIGVLIEDGEVKKVDHLEAAS